MQEIRHNVCFLFLASSILLIFLSGCQHYVEITNQNIPHHLPVVSVSPTKLYLFEKDENLSFSQDSRVELVSKDGEKINIFADQVVRKDGRIKIYFILDEPVETGKYELRIFNEKERNIYSFEAVKKIVTPNKYIGVHD